MSHLDSLAGLDSMVLHINTHSKPSPTISNTAIPLDGESYVLVPRKRRKLGRARRTPLADKTASFNNNGSSMLDYGVPRKVDISMSDSPSFNPIASRRNSLSGLPSFKPLPPMPVCSPLRTSFLDISLHPTTPLLPESHLEATPPTIPSSILPQQSCADLAQDYPKSDKVALQKIHDDPFFIPAFQHPNSPYVPWAPPVRHRILRPSAPASRVSVLSGCYSRPVSRSGARAPEPAETPEPVQPLLPPSNGWKLFRHTISKGINRIVIRFGAWKRPLAAKRPTSASTCRASGASVSLEDTFLAANYSSSHNSPLPVTGRRLFMPSTASLISSDSATLAAWLAERQRASLDERDYDPASMMSLEEYERMGSWLCLSGDKNIEGKWVCAVPGCELHARHVLMHGSQVTTPDFAAANKNLTQSSFLPLQRNATHSGLSPQSRACAHVSSARRWPTSATAADGSLPITGFSDEVDWERHMPGGWTF